jgi:hypothetical protein
MSYRTAFDRVSDMVDTESMCIKGRPCPPERPLVTLQPQQGLLIVTVGPPARGKSATYSAVCEILQAPAQSVTPVRVMLYNAGDVRRLWEQSVKSRYSRAPAKEVTAFLHKMKKKGLLSKEAGEKVAGQFREWLSSEASSAIPGSIFRHFAGLNELFAQACYSEAIKAAREGGMAFFDATNTDRKRRSDILEAFGRDGGDAQLLFLENICLSVQQLKNNFWSKLTTSGDYKGLVTSACKGRDPPRDSTSLFDYELLATAKEESNVCRKTVVHSMADITSRDKGYLLKYVPLHKDEGPGQPSTIHQMRELNAQSPRYGYVQAIVPQCLTDTATRPRLARFRSNLALDRQGLARRLLARLVSKPRAKSSSYDQENRWRPGPAVVAQLVG